MRCEEHGPKIRQNKASQLSMGFFHHKCQNPDTKITLCWDFTLYGSVRVERLGMALDFLADSVYIFIGHIYFCVTVFIA